MLVAFPTAFRSPRVAGILKRLAFLSFATYLILLLGTNSVAGTGGALSWLPLWRLPTAANEWVVVGVVSLLPLISIAAWLTARLSTDGRIDLHWGWRRVLWPSAALLALGSVAVLLPCLNSNCAVPQIIRFLLISLNMVWLYLYLVNEEVDLFWIVISIIALQAVVAIGQFVHQTDLGLAFLGESKLDPAVSGISVVMRGPERWLRAYGFATHPNILAGTLTPMLLLLILLWPGSAEPRRWIAAAVFLLGFTALLTTLSRWALTCLLLGLVINAVPLIRQSARHRRPVISPLAAGTAVATLLMALIFVSLYGDATAGRVVNLETSVESRSLWERERDTGISLKVIATHPLTGIGIGNYVAAARAYDPWAETVHVMPLLLAAELGLGGALIWLLLVIGPVWRRGALGRYAPETGLWLAFWLLGLLYPAPYPLYELRSALLAGLFAAVISRSDGRTI